MMRYLYSALMLAAALILLLYSLALSRGGERLIPREWAEDAKDKKTLAKRLGKAVLIVAAAPGVSCIFGLIADPEKYSFAAFLVPVAALAVCTYFGIKKIKDVL